MYLPDQALGEAPFLQDLSDDAFAAPTNAPKPQGRADAVRTAFHQAP